MVKSQQPKALRVGNCVQIHGLQRGSRYNGTTGTIRAILDNQKLGVELVVDGMTLSGVISAKAENLLFLDTGTAVEDTKVWLSAKQLCEQQQKRLHDAKAWGERYQQQETQLARISNANTRIFGSCGRMFQPPAAAPASAPAEAAAPPAPTYSGPFSFDVLDSDKDGKITFAEYVAGFALIDTDKDGFISRAEFGTECAAPFALLDKDGDGKLTKAEYEAGFKLFDIDGDGFISKEEFNGSVAPHFSFESLDTDGDGRISQAEYNKGFDLLDFNKDGFVSEMEFNCVCTVPFKLLDQDGDGMISRQEWENGFKVFDIDGDGSITKSEFHIVSRSGFIFEMLDADGDGQITQKEYNAGFDLLDRDKDGFLSRQEFGNIPTEHFQLLDKDKDGKLSRAEYESGFALMDIGERFLFPTTHALLRGPHHSTRVPLQGVYSAVAFTMQNRDPLLVGAPIRITAETGTGGALGIGVGGRISMVHASVCTSAALCDFAHTCLLLIPF